MSILNNPEKFFGVNEVQGLLRQIPDLRERVFVQMLCHRAMMCGDFELEPFVKEPEMPLDLIFLVTVGRDMYRLKNAILEALTGDPENVDPFVHED